MVVVAIIAFLSSIAISTYTTYFAKAKQAEAALVLASLHTAEQAYWATYGTYSTNLKEIGFNIKDSTYQYTYGFWFPGAQEGVHYVVGKLKTPAHTLGHCHADQNGFIAKAAGNIVKNKLDVWSMNETRNIRHEQNGV